MFKKRILFILGVGLSFEVKLLVGLGLVKDIVMKFDVWFGDDNCNVGFGDKYLFGKFQIFFL